MFNVKSLAEKPIVQIIPINKQIETPPPEDISQSSWLQYAIENDEVDMIYGMRSVPKIDCLALKIQYKGDNGPQSDIIKKPSLKVLKYLYDCGHPDFNFGIKHYMKFSRHAFHQFSYKKQYPENTHCYDWFFAVILGRV